MTVNDQLKRARPTVDSPTYRRLTEQISEQEYRRLLDEERSKLGLPANKKQAAQGG